MKVYQASAGGFGGPQLGFFLKKEKAKAAFYKDYPQSRGRENEWGWDGARGTHFLRLRDLDIALNIREHPLQ